MHKVSWAIWAFAFLFCVSLLCFLLPFSPTEPFPDESTQALHAPNSVHWLGTDDTGRDVAARMLYGLRNSILFGVVTTVCIVILATFLGLLFGYLGGNADFVFSRVAETFASLPSLYVFLVIAVLFPKQPLVPWLCWIGLSWVSLSQYVRLDVVRLRNETFYAAAIASGIPPVRLLWKHFLPHAMVPIVTFAPFLLAQTLGTFAALEALGISPVVNGATLGELINQGRNNLESWWLSVLPVLLLVTVLWLVHQIAEEARRKDPRSFGM